MDSFERPFDTGEVMTPTATSTHANGVQPGTEGVRPFGLFTALLWLQGVYYLVTGVWPLVSIETFQMVTGRKTDHLETGREADHWLVMTVGVLITAVALTLLLAAWRRKNPRRWASWRWPAPSE